MILTSARLSTKPSFEDLTRIQSLLDLIVGRAALDLTYTATAADGLSVLLTGPDVPHLLARNAELLLALEHLATQALRLEPHQHDQVSFDAGNFKATRLRALERFAHTATQHVRSTHTPFHFPPMNSRERRILHLVLASTELPTQSEGEGPQRHLVLHPLTVSKELA